MEEHGNASQTDIVKSLKRTEGHVHSVADMIETGKPCLDVAQQLQAVEKGHNSGEAHPPPGSARPLPRGPHHSD